MLSAVRCLLFAVYCLLFTVDRFTFRELYSAQKNSQQAQIQIGHSPEFYRSVPQSVSADYADYEIIKSGQQSVIGNQYSAESNQQFRMFKNKEEVYGMRLTRKDKNGPTLGISAPTPVVKSPSTLAVKNALTLVLLGLLVTWGCSKAGTNRQASSNDQPGGSAEATPQSGSVPTISGGAPAAPAAVVIATADGENPGTRVEITEIKRSSDNTLTLRFAMVNDSAEALVFNYNYGDPDHSIKDFNSVAGVTLVDGTNKKKYFVVRDTENACLCSKGLKDIPAKSRGNVWAKFPAPPDDVQKISIVIPHFGPIDDVPISR